MLKCGENIKSCSKIAKKEVSRLKLSTGWSRSKYSKYSCVWSLTKNKWKI
jgi:hypothetical protein